MTFDEFCATHGITVEILRDRGAQVDREGWEHHAYDLRLHFEGRTLNTPWRQGTGIDTSPTDEPGDVLQSIVMDADLGDRDFDEFCADLGYDTDSRKAHAAWLDCQLMAVRLPEWAGPFADEIKGLEE